MDISERTLKVLEWTTILGHLSKHATTENGKERCLNTPVYSNPEQINHELKLTSEGRYLLDHAFIPPLEGIRNIGEFINKAKIGQILLNQELIDIGNTLGAARRLRSFFYKFQEHSPLLHLLAHDLFEDRDLEEEILDTFEDDGEVKDNASFALKRLKSSYRDQLANLKHKLNNLVQSSAISKYLQENVYTQRGDRFVVPVKVEFKSLVPGIVHDSSSSGATLFIEPKAIVELNNSLKELELQIDHEIKRILAQLTSKIREKIDEISYTKSILTEIDFVFSKAKYSIQLKGTEPTINNEKFISLHNVKHPILITTIDKVVQNSIEIGKDWNSLIITGSNTGGKTVILKSVGLCTLMTKAGLHIPAIEANIYPFKHIFADIGDEQSIIQNLSTFSGHMTNIINILNKVDKDSLVLLDEIGAGTDPQEGSALAHAILGYLHSKEARTIVTTHYGELKALAYTEKGYYNASVEFDIDSLAPTFKLLMGIPGKSNAITIAQNLGLNSDIAKEAQHIYITQKDSTGEVLEGLQHTQHELSKNAQKVESTKEELERLEKDYNEKIDKINSEKKKTVSIYKKKFDAELLNAKEEIKGILDEVRRTKSEKVARRSFNRLGEIESDFKSTTIDGLEEIEPKYQPIDWNKIKTGDIVFIKDLEQEATLLDLPDKNNNVNVQLGQLKTVIKANKIVKYDKNRPKKQEKAQTYGKGFKISRSNLGNTLDLRGMRVEDAIDQVEFYLDRASLENVTPVYIIHGHGTGALRDAVRDYLKTSPYVEKYRSGENMEGGNGVSVVDIA